MGLIFYVMGAVTLTLFFEREDRKSQIPRHNEIVDELARKISKDLKIPYMR